MKRKMKKEKKNRISMEARKSGGRGTRGEIARVDAGRRGADRGGECGGGAIVLIAW